MKLKNSRTLIFLVLVSRLSTTLAADDPYSEYIQKELAAQTGFREFCRIGTTKKITIFMLRPAMEAFLFGNTLNSVPEKVTPAKPPSPPSTPQKPMRQTGLPISATTSSSSASSSAPPSSQVPVKPIDS